MLNDLLSRWPLIRQLQTGADGTGVEAMSERTRNLVRKTHGAEVTRSICPYCGVGCGQLVYHKDGKLISIEGDPWVCSDLLALPARRLGGELKLALPAVH